jgi:hypothetical protein
MSKHNEITFMVPLDRPNDEKAVNSLVTMHDVLRRYADNPSMVERLPSALTAALFGMILTYRDMHGRIQAGQTHVRAGSLATMLEPKIVFGPYIEDRGQPAPE